MPRWLKCRKAYEAAVAAWEALKVKIDAEAPRPHERQYEEAIDQWEQVLAWSNRYGDREYAELAAKKLEALRRRFLTPHLTPLAREDWFEAVFDPPGWAKMLGLEELLETPPLDEPLVLIAPGSEHVAELDGSPKRIAREIWHDRLETQKRKAAPEEDSLQAYIQKYLEKKETQASAGEISIGRCYALKLHLMHFQDWLGKDTAVKEINGEVLENYYTYLLKKATSKTWSKTTSRHYLNTVKSFVRWLWHSEAIPSLPRVLDGKSQALTITKPASRIVVFSKEEVTGLLAAASDRTKLYILMMLNCGMTQKDIADLAVSEVDWKEGRIIRKRSKTADCENVPTVNYKLWPETFRLLQQERASDSQTLVLLNSNGSPLWSEEIGSGGKYQKTDNIKNAFDRLRKVEKPLKSLKKTSASLLRDSGTFSSLEGLFLGHAPQSMSDKHYAQVPQRLLDQAVEWLGQQYGLI